MIHTYPNGIWTRRDIRALHPNAAIIRNLPDRTLVFDHADDAYMHETRVVIEPLNRSVAL